MITLVFICYYRSYEPAHYFTTIINGGFSLSLLPKTNVAIATAQDLNEIAVRRLSLFTRYSSRIIQCYIDVINRNTFWCAGTSLSIQPHISEFNYVFVITWQ